MVWLLIIFTVLFTLLVYILLAPVYVEIDSTKDLYGIRFHKLLRVSLKTDGDGLIELKLMGWKKQIGRFGPVKYKQNEIPETPKSVTRKAGLKLNKIVSILKSFKVKTLDISFDSCDMQLNGMLFPVFYFAAFYFNKKIRISFTGENHVILQMQNRLGRMAAAYLWP